MDGIVQGSAGIKDELFVSGFLCCLEHLRGCHQILNILAQHLVLRPQPQILLLDIVHLAAEVLQCVLQLQNLADQSGFLFKVLLLSLNNGCCFLQII